jgi:hypothetical protein
MAETRSKVLSIAQRILLGVRRTECLRAWYPDNVYTDNDAESQSLKPMCAQLAPVGQLCRESCE